MRFAVVAILGTTLSESGFPIITALLIIFAIMIAVLQPYKSPSHNVRNTCTILLLVLYFTSVTGSIISFTERAWIRTVSYALSSLFFLILLVYEIVWLLYKLLGRRRVVQQAVAKFQSLLPCNCRRLARTIAISEESLPDRITNPDQYTSLLVETVGDHEANSLESQETLY